MPLVPIVTPRLQLRALEPSDAASVFDILGDERTTAMVSWRQTTLEATAAWVDRRVRDEARHGLSMWAVERLPTSEMVGLVGFFPREDGTVELGYVVHAQHWGNGYGTEATRAALAALDDGHRARRLIATIRPLNTRSLSVAHAVGLRQTGTYVDDRGKMHVFSVDKLTSS